MPPRYRNDTRAKPAADRRAKYATAITVQPSNAPPEVFLSWSYDQIAAGRDPNEILDQLTEILRAQYEVIEGGCEARRRASQVVLAAAVGCLLFWFSVRRLHPAQGVRPPRGEKLIFQWFAQREQ